MTGREGAAGAMLVVISGPSGVGKDAILDVLRGLPGHSGHHYVVTCTTRARRPGEIDGISYHFLDSDQFLALRAAGGLLEANEVHGNWYGTPREQVADALAAGRHAILKIDVQGADVVRARVPDALLIFVAPPSVDALLERLTGRATETHAELLLRQRNAAEEMARRMDYDYVVINETGQVERTAEQIAEIIVREEANHAGRRVRI
ncbi:MAG: guanylate kinase [Candidatus Limnocylindrales bacterium]